MTTEILSFTEWQNLLAVLRQTIERYGWQNVQDAVKYLEQAVSDGN